jgi:hypothetical protein
MGGFTVVGKDEEGAALVEAAVLFPFLAVLLFGAFEVSRILLDRHLVETGVRDAARYLARTDDPLAAGNRLQARRIAVFGTADGSGAPRLGWWAPPELVGGDCGSFCALVTETVNIDPTTGGKRFRGGDTVRSVEVVAFLDHPGLGTFRLLGIPGLRMRVAHRERVIGE